MKYLNIFLITSLVLLNVSCNKEIASTQSELMNNMLTNKSWYLDYSINGNNIKSYLGQSTYIITYYKDGRTEDSDGLAGTYTIEMVNNKSQIHVQVKTNNGNSLEVVYDIVSVGTSKLVLLKNNSTQSSSTQLFFSNK